MGLFNRQRTDGVTYDGQGEERVGFIDNVFHNLEKGILLRRHPYDNLSTRAKVTVQEGQEMVFCSEGMFSDVFTPGPHTISTNNIPFLQQIMQIPFGGESAFKTTLFIVSTTRQRLAGNQGGWGLGMTVHDYTLGDEGIMIKVGAFGSYEFRIVDSIAFIKEYSGTQHEITLQDFTDEFTSAVANQVKPNLNRYFSKHNVPVRFPFGYGLSYTTFEKTEWTKAGDAYEQTITNTGDRFGGEVAQLFLNGELAGFQKVYLDPGESTTVRIVPEDKDKTVYSDELVVKPEPLPFPVTLESRFTDLKQTFLGRILFNAVLSVADKQAKEAEKLPALPEVVVPGCDFVQLTIDN